ncbi:MAG: hypothetical protein IJ769_02375 [Clostridia bacterium]|nr:hypothetical protein [Clostridia bacterium]
MKLCGETITLFNARQNGDTGGQIYMPTVIVGCAWRRGQRAELDPKGGLMAADEYVVRIPVDADFGGKHYADPITWRQGGAENGFTLQRGDIVARGAVKGEGWTPSKLKAACADCFTVLGVTDNRRAPHGAHWRLVGT